MPDLINHWRNKWREAMEELEKLGESRSKRKPSEATPEKVQRSSPSNPLLKSQPRSTSRKQVIGALALIATGIALDEGIRYASRNLSLSGISQRLSEDARLNEGENIFLTPGAHPLHYDGLPQHLDTFISEVAQLEQLPKQAQDLLTNHPVKRTTVNRSDRFSFPRLNPFDGNQGKSLYFSASGIHPESGKPSALYSLAFVHGEINDSTFPEGLELTTLSGSNDRMLSYRINLIKAGFDLEKGEDDFSTSFRRAYKALESHWATHYSNVQKQASDF